MRPDIAGRAKNTARRLVRSRQRALELRSRRPPNLTVSPAAGRPVVYYLAPHTPKPSGGVRMLYRHVDLLNAAGIRAAVLHAQEGFRCEWFDNTTPIVTPRTIGLRADDILVIPEYYGSGLAVLPREVRKFVINQGAYVTFDLIDRETTVAGAPYAQVPNLLGIITVSEDSAELLRFGFPEIEISLCRPVIDSQLFHLSAAPRRRAVAYFPSRRSDELHQLLHLLRARGLDWDLVPIDGMTEREVATTLRQCAVFLSLSERDGFGLPPAEAMASGCYVVGYPGGGGREFFDAAYCAPVSNLAEFAATVMSAVARPLPELAALGAAASVQILSRYTNEGLQEDLVRVYGAHVEWGKSPEPTGGRAAADS